MWKAKAVTTGGPSIGQCSTRCAMSDKNIMRCSDCGAWTYKQKPTKRRRDPLHRGVDQAYTPVVLCQYCDLTERVRIDERNRLAANTG